MLKILPLEIWLAESSIMIATDDWNIAAWPKFSIARLVLVLRDAAWNLFRASSYLSASCFSLLKYYKNIIARFNFVFDELNFYFDCFKVDERVNCLVSSFIFRLVHVNSKLCPPLSDEECVGSVHTDIAQSNTCKRPSKIVALWNNVWYRFSANLRAIQELPKWSLQA